MQAIGSVKKFDHFFRNIVQRTCEEWVYDAPSEEYYLYIYGRLPQGLRKIISSGLESKIIFDVGLSKSKSAAFRPCGVPKTKGPYSWFERDNQRRQPRPCWEYFIHLAEYIRLYEAFHGKDYRLSFEDELMDIGIYKNKKLWVCCEIKEKSSQAQNLIRGIKKFENSNDFPDSDRGNDPLRKAKYIIKLKPEYFYIVSIGRRFEFRIKYPDNNQFQLVKDLIPLV